jgi:hypothetical protein
MPREDQLKQDNARLRSALEKLDAQLADWGHGEECPRTWECEERQDECECRACEELEHKQSDGYCNFCGNEECPTCDCSVGEAREIIKKALTPTEPKELEHGAEWCGKDDCGLCEQPGHGEEPATCPICEAPYVLVYCSRCNWEAKIRRPGSNVPDRAGIKAMVAEGQEIRKAVAEKTRGMTGNTGSIGPCEAPVCVTLTACVGPSGRRRCPAHGGIQRGVK